MRSCPMSSARSWWPWQSTSSRTLGNERAYPGRRPSSIDVGQAAFKVPRLGGAPLAGGGQRGQQARGRDESGDEPADAHLVTRRQLLVEHVEQNRAAQQCAQ